MNLIIRLNSIIFIFCFIFLVGTIISPCILSSRPIFLNNRENILEEESLSLKNMKNRFGYSTTIRNTFNNFFETRNTFRSLFSCTIHTKCNDVEKSTEILFGALNDIDVDDNENTGENGNDIRVQYILMPWIEFDTDLFIGLLYTISVERICEEIKNSDFNISIELGGSIFIGFWSPGVIGNEIPKSTRISFLFLFNPFINTNGVEFYFDPEYDTNNDDKKIILFAEYIFLGVQRSLSFEFDPAIKTQLRVMSTRQEGLWNYNFIRESNFDSKVTARFRTIKEGEEKVTIFIIDKLPTDISFSLGLTPFRREGGRFIYESDDMYNVEIMVLTDDLGICKYAIIRNTPKRIFAEWTPSLIDGSYFFSIESDGTDFILKDRLVDPIVNLSIMDITSINTTAFWNLTNPGDFTVIKNSDLHVDLEINIGEWNAKLDAQPSADYISTSWLIGVSGFLSIDTDRQSLNTINLLIRGGDLGFHTIGETFKAEDFSISWTLWPPEELDLDINGFIDFAEIAIDVYLLGWGWLRIWPW